MIISFSKYFCKEFFNGKEYPIGTTFIKIYNQMSSLVTNSNFELSTYKNSDFYEYQYNTLAHMGLEKILDIFNLNTKDIYNNIKDTHIEIENVELTLEEFKKLVFFILQLDEFVRLSQKEKKLNSPEYFLLFFTTLNDYTFPTQLIEAPEVSAKYDNILKTHLKEHESNYDSNKHYNDILSCDKNILKDFKKADNIRHTYNCTDFIQVLLASYFYILKQKLNLKQCRNCKRFFIASNGNQEFCDNIRPKEINETQENYNKTKMSCRNYNNKILSYRNTDDVKKAIRSVRLRIQKRKRKGLESQKYLDDWEESIRTHRQTYTHSNRYIEWILNESDIHQIRRKNNGSSRNNKK